MLYNFDHLIKRESILNTHLLESTHRADDLKAVL